MGKWHIACPEVRIYRSKVSGEKDIAPLRADDNIGVPFGAGKDCYCSQGVGAGDKQRFLAYQCGDKLRRADEIRPQHDSNRCKRKQIKATESKTGVKEKRRKAPLFPPFLFSPLNPLIIYPPIIPQKKEKRKERGAPRAPYARARMETIMEIIKPCKLYE